MSEPSNILTKTATGIQGLDEIFTGVAALFTSLTAGGSVLEHTDTAISSLIDTWLLLRDIETAGERNRGINILKSRGMAHSNLICEFILSDRGIELCKPSVGPGGLLTGSARLAREAEEEAARLARRQEIERRQRELEQKRRQLETRIAGLSAAFASEEAELMEIITREQGSESSIETAGKRHDK